MRRRELLLCTALVGSLSACHKSATVGGFALDVPPGWYTESEEPGTLAVGTKHAEWTFVLISFTAAEVEGDKSLDAVGREVAEELTKDDPETAEDDVTMTFGEPTTWSRPGIEGLTMDGSMSSADLSIALEMVVVIAADRYMVALGFRSPDASDKDDAAMQAMLDSIRTAG